MKKQLVILSAIAFILVLIRPTQFVQATEESTSEKEIIYFYSPTCGACQEVAPHIAKLSEQGIEVTKFNTTNPDVNNIKKLKSYNATYFVPESEGTVPIIFAGNQYIAGVDDIIKAIEDGTIHDLAKDDLKHVEVSDFKIDGFLGYVTIIFSGLLDGFNPCAIAMLLLFISLLGFTDNRKTLIAVSITYISALYLTYFALGTVLYRFIGTYQTQIAYLSTFISWFIIILTGFLFILSLYDYVVSKNEEYGKIKLQLPKSLKKLNQRIIKTFTNALNNKDYKSLIPVLALTFVLGFIISLTEFLCTGQVYLPIIIALVQYGDSMFMSVIMLAIYNLMFVLPLIVIAVTAIKYQSVLTTSDFIRERLHLIKLFTALFFLGICLFFIITTFFI